MKPRRKLTSAARADPTATALRECLPLFQALGDRYRQDIILLLADRETLNVNQIAGCIPLSRPAISHHLKILRIAGLVVASRQGTENYYRLQVEDAIAALSRLTREVERSCA